MHFSYEPPKSKEDDKTQSIKTPSLTINTRPSKQPLEYVSDEFRYALTSTVSRIKQEGYSGSILEQPEVHDLMEDSCREIIMNNQSTSGFILDTMEIISKITGDRPSALVQYYKPGSKPKSACPPSNSLFIIRD